MTRQASPLHGADVVARAIDNIGDYTPRLDLNIMLTQQLQRRATYNLSVKPHNAACHHQCRSTLAHDLVGNHSPRKKSRLREEQLVQIFHTSLAKDAGSVVVTYHTRTLLGVEPMD